MNPTDDKLPQKTADKNNTEQEISMSDGEENTSSPEDFSLRQRELTTQFNSTHSLETKRSAVKKLIELYFYQLQRGCGNPKCSNINCASSGKVAPMTPNEIAAKAIHLFLQDAKLCESYTQPPKVPRTGPQHESPTSSSRLVSNPTPLDITVAMDSFTARERSSGSSSTPNSTITSGSSTSSSNSSNSCSNSCDTEENPVFVQSGEATSAAIVKEATTADASKSKSSDPPTPTAALVEYLDEQIIDEIIEECKKCKSYDRLINAINDVYRSVNKLSKSFRRPPLAKLTSTATASKLQEILGKSPQELKKEDLRTLEGEHDKDEDSTCMEDVNERDRIEEGRNDANNVNNEHATTANQSGSTGETCTCSSSVAIHGAVDDNIEPMDEDANSDDLLDCTEWPPVNYNSTKSSDNYDTQVDFESLRRVKKKLHGLKEETVSKALKENIIKLADNIISYGCFYNWEDVLHCFVICFDMSMTFTKRFTDFEYMEETMPKICQAVQDMPVRIQSKLARIWATYCKDYLYPFIQSLHQLITLQVIKDEDTVQENSDVIAITKVLKIIFYANIMAGEIDSYNNSAAGKFSAAEDEAASGSSVGVASFSNDDDDVFPYNSIISPYHKSFAEDKLEKELKVSCIDCRVPLVPFEEFYNEPLSDAIQMDRDYLSYKNLSLDPLGEDHFSFMLYSFILTPATKVIALYYDSRIRMYSERNSSIYSLLHYFGDGNDTVAQPNLKLKVRRDNIVNDALIGLELVAMSNPKDLKKQLVVEFVGEQGIDEGGVSKEFFQLMVEEIFNPDFGMFTHQEDTNTMWFNSTPFENEAQFTLIGIIIGLAIYNNIILAVNFPMVVYRKLMGARGSFYDLKDWNPILYRSLNSMIEYEDPDMEEVFMQTFKISYKNVFDEVVEHELKPGGSEILVNQDNKQEFVDLYSDFLLNKNIERQFKAFKKGFEMVTDESPLKLLFRPEEIELLVCGSRKFDFEELEFSTEYEGGYTIETPIIKDFWSIVHNLPEDSKRKLLEFTTGSDRVPVGGLSRLKLLITRHGPDSDRLPTSHTCFNVLLLPEYSSKEKLEERLLKAINYSKGFGML